MALELISALIAALDADEPERCLAAALQVLSERGLAQPNAAASVSSAWLTIEREGRSIALVAALGVELPDRATRTLIAQLLGTALTRTIEHRELRRVRERLQLLTTASFEGVVIHSGGVVIDCNERFCELVGYSRAEMMEPGAMLRGIAPEDHATTQARIRERTEGEFLLTVVRKDGTRFRAEFTTKQTKLGDLPIRVVALRDVTERERTADLLREGETRLRQLLEATFDCVVLSRDGVILDTSDGAERFFGQTREQLIGRPVLDWVAPAARENVSQRLKEQTIGTYEAIAIGAQAQPIPVEVVTVMSTFGSQPVRVGGLRDLRPARRLEQERRHLELQAERSQRLDSLGVLAGGIAHDFNNLLVGVLGSAELLLATLKDPEQRAMAEAIRMAGDRAASLTKQMLAYAGRRDLHEPEPVDLAALWRELRELLDAALSKKARVEFELAPDSVVSGERAALTQMMMNLLTNASDALDGQPGTIQISTQRVREPDARWDDALGARVRPGEWILVRVRDNGVGMDEATQRRIFEPFFTTKPGGHGLGLGSCLAIVEAHGGAILVESAPKQGTTFSLLLPATQIRSAPEVIAAAAPAPCKVLVVDDEPLVRSHLRRLLERRGFAVESAPNAHAGLEAVALAEPDLILLDMTMPDLDGVEVIRRLRAAGSRVPIVLCSGNLHGAVERGLQPGMVQGMLQKPFSTKELLEAIERARAL